jgi:DNA polymerase I-like protein with 3'-5' exonuclease and polymerase domains
MIRDFRIENHLFSPHLRNGSYGAFFEQATEYSIDMTDTATVASSLWHIDAIVISHPILELESQISTVLATMEVHGVYIDKNILDALEQELSKAIQNIESKVASQTGDNSVNLSSPLQLQKLLFEVM